jgi:hypothetical protein
MLSVNFVPNISPMRWLLNRGGDYRCEEVILTKFLRLPYVALSY